MNNDVLEKVDEIVSEIENSPEYQKYLTLKEKISSNKELMELINKVRVLQKDYVHHLCSKKELDSVNTKLNDNPLYREYSNTIAEINNTYNIIETSLNSYFDSQLNDK